MARKKAAKKKVAKNRAVGKTKPQDDLLIELGTEELPPKALKNLSKSFGENLYDLLCDAGLIANDVSDYKIFSTPRRLAVLFPSIDIKQQDRESFKSGPKVEVAYDSDGRPTRVAEGFARGLGTSVEKLEQIDGRIGRLVKIKGKLARELIPNILETALKKLPVPKRMRWGNLDAEFVRPVHWLVILHGDKVIPAEILAVKSGRRTCGHRFHAPNWISIAHARDYEKTLKKAFVVADYETRQQKIKKAAEELAIKHKGKAIIDNDLLDEVTGLVEWPEAIFANFDKEFLDIPAKALISTMQEHQKYFPVTNKNGKLLPHFITISNIKSKQKARVREGNERVIRARFADAKFFWDTDCKQHLESHRDRLKNVIFHNRIGSLYEKTENISAAAGQIVKDLNGNSNDVANAERAGKLSKADLMTNMVYEFPELQGTMGRYYAEHDGEDSEVSVSIEEQYMPRFGGDDIPQSSIGRALAIADKLDTLVGIYGVGEIPSGEKDPFALRRAALGVLRIMIEGQLDLDLKKLILATCYRHPRIVDIGIIPEQVYAFMMDRLRAYYVDAGISVDVFEAVRARNPDKPHDFDKRVRAVMAFRKLKEADSLTTANKRIRNILKQGGDVDWDHVSEGLLQESAEKNLANKIKALSKEIMPLYDQGDYTAAMKKLAALRPEVDDFFDNVMVMVDEEAVRDNRLALLSSLSQLFLRVADLSRLQD